jgi:aryl carrier-like protein
MSIRAVIFHEIATIATQQHKTLRPLTDDLPLIDSGLDSLCLAILVAKLDDELNIDPFGVGDGVAIPTTVGEFVRLYEAATATA